MYDSTTDPRCLFFFFFIFIFFFKHKTAYDIRPRDWSSDVCSSDLAAKNQKERLYVLYEQLPVLHDGLTSSFPRWEVQTQLFPLILTWKNHQLDVFENVPICSIDYFEDFIIDRKSVV